MIIIYIYIYFGFLGFPITAIREIKLLKLMSHKNIIRLREIIVSKPSMRNNYRGFFFFYLIFELLNIYIYIITYFRFYIFGI